MPIPARSRPEEFVRRYWSEDQRVPKHVRLRNAFEASISDGFWATGARLPTETELVSATACSLGTVQRAFRELASSGLVVRKRGSGSTVADMNSGIEAPWHIRYFDETDDGRTYLPVYTTVLSRRIVKAPGPWSAPLGQNKEPVVRIDRIFSVNSEFRIYARFWAIATRFPELVELPAKALDGQNFKLFIARRYQVPVHKVRQTIRHEVPPDLIVRQSDCIAQVPTMVLNVVAFALHGEPIYYQDFYIPPSGYHLDLGTSSRS